MNNPPRILFDLDETLYLGDVVKVAIPIARKRGYIGPDLTGSDVKDFNFSNFAPVLREVIFELFKDPVVAAIEKKPLSGAYPFIYYIKMVKHWNIGILTARPKQLHEVTRFCLWRDFPSITWDFIGFANQTTRHEASISKRRALDTWKPDYYFDDYLGFCEEAVQAGVPCVHLIRNKHTGWNLDKQASEYIRPIKSILEFNVINGV